MTAALLALLFLPDPAALDWAAFSAAVSSAPHRFTVALSAEETPEVQRAWLKEAAASGRIELALRLPHDPLLPLLNRRSPAAAAEGLAASRAAFRAAFGVEPAGFVAGGAALDEASRRALAAQGFAWTAAGAGAYSRPWRAAGTLLAVPLSPAFPPSEPAAGVVASSGLPALAAALAAGPWTTVGAAAAAAEPFGIAPSSWPAWDGAETWLESTATRKASAYFTRAADALARFQSSGHAAEDRLERGTEALRSAAAVRHFRPGAPPEPLAAAVAAVYKEIGEPAPGLEGDAPGAVEAALLANGVEFRNAEGSTVPWRPASLRVERVSGDVAVTVRASSAAAALYIDLNGLAGIGSTRLMAGRREALRARDAWEFAALVGPSGAALWRVGTGEPGRLEDLKAESVDGELRFVLPGKRLRGNPSGWGFLLLTTPAEGGGPAALLGSAEDQKKLSAGGPPPVLKAVRLLSER
ncbi:hypothetical protein EPO15_13805 [bacterium]|nr:MAG: hypothetical protein EPO15_13805 [bacterium]